MPSGMSSSSASTIASISTSSSNPQQSGCYGSYFSLSFEETLKSLKLGYIVEAIENH